MCVIVLVLCSDYKLLASPTTVLFSFFCCVYIFNLFGIATNSLVVVVKELRLEWWGNNSEKEGTTKNWCIIIILLTEA